MPQQVLQLADELSLRGMPRPETGEQLAASIDSPMGLIDASRQLAVPVFTARSRFSAPTGPANKSAFD